MPISASTTTPWVCDGKRAKAEEKKTKYFSAVWRIYHRETYRFVWFIFFYGLRAWIFIYFVKCCLHKFHLIFVSSSLANSRSCSVCVYCICVDGAKKKEKSKYAISYAISTRDYTTCTGTQKNADFFVIISLALLLRVCLCPRKSEVISCWNRWKSIQMPTERRSNGSFSVVKFRKFVTIGIAIPRSLVASKSIVELTGNF